MTRQITLFDSRPSVTAPVPAPHNVSEASREAAERVAPKAGSQRARVLDFIRSCGRRGATNAEIAEALEMPIQTVCPRANELWKAEWITKSGQRRDGSEPWIENEVAP